MFKRGEVNMNVRGQLTIFIVIAIVIVAVIILFFVFKIDVSKITKTPSFENPFQYIEQCSIDAVQEAIDVMLPQGGYLNPSLYKKYNDDNIALLCYTSNNYERCINQNPMYLAHLENEIKTAISPKLEQCFLNLKEEYDAKRIINEISENMNVDVQLVEGKVLITIERAIKLSKDGGVEEYNEFKSSLLSPLYQMGRVAEEIVNQEARFCYSEYMGYMLLYPWVKITRLDIGSEFKIYFIEDKESGKKLNIAVRSCALPATY